VTPDVRPIGPIQVPVTTSVSLDVEAWILHFAGGYNLYSEGKSRLDLIGGARYLKFDQTISESKVYCSSKVVPPCDNTFEVV